MKLARRSLLLPTLVFASAACMSVGPSNQALARISGPDSPGPNTQHVRNDAVVRITFANPAPQPAFNGNGDATTLPTARNVIGRVSHRSGDSLWIAVAQLTTPDASVVNYPARGPEARLVPVRVDGSATTAHVVSARPHFVEMAMTSGLVITVVLFGLLLLALQDYT